MRRKFSGKKKYIFPLVLFLSLNSFGMHAKNYLEKFKSILKHAGIFCAGGALVYIYTQNQRKNQDHATIKNQDRTNKISITKTKIIEVNIRPSNIFLKSKPKPCSCKTYYLLDDQNTPYIYVSKKENEKLGMPLEPNMCYYFVSDPRTYRAVLVKETAPEEIIEPQEPSVVIEDEDET